VLKQRPAVRLLTIVGLLLVPIVLLGYLFFESTNGNIAVAKKERDGVALLRVIVPVVAKLSIDGAQPSTEEIEALRQAGRKLGRGLLVADTLEAFVNQLERGNAGDAVALKQGRELIVRVGDTSNLILDPDLDSYYLMDVVVGRIPELMKLSADLSGHAEVHGTEVIELGAEKHRQLAVGEFSASLWAFKTAVNKAVESAEAGRIEENLVGQATEFAAQASTHSFNFLKMEELALDNLKTSGQLRVMQQNFSTAALTMWTMAATNLDGLLQYRIEQFRRQQIIAGLTTLFVTLAAIGLAIKLLSRIMGKLDEHIVYLAHHDAMTKLKNRSAFSASLEAEFVKIHQNNKTSALHVVDIDHFKTINDRLGHQLGDAVLVGVADRLAAVCGQNETIGRLGGDEFVVLQHDVTDTWQVLSLADRLVTALREPLDIQKKPFKVSLSVGSAIAPLHGKAAENLMHSADLALYAAKAAGRDRSCLYTDELSSEMVERQKLENEVRSALADNRFFLNFQAQFNANGKTLRGFEALLRLRTMSGETIPPLKFIPLVEQMGLIDDVGAWVLEKAAVTAANWPKQVSLAVNISPLQLKSGKLCDAIRKALQISGLAPAQLEIEVTENMLMDDSKSVIQQLQEIKAMGVSIALDDFGSGYSSLSYLWRFPFNKLKIDRSFMRAYEADRVQAENILRTIVMLGHSLKMTVTAEGVETNAQADFLNHVECDEIQGFLYAKPVPEQDLAAVMMNAFEDEIEDQKLISLLAPDNTKAIGKLFSRDKLKLS
jgi:diguanylate cyclase (GGDEF)-like protein